MVKKVKRKNITRLFEERGVAAFSYKGVIDDIIMWCRDKCKKLDPYEYSFYTDYVPYKIIKQIDFVRHLEVLVHISDVETLTSDMRCDGEVYPSDFNDYRLTSDGDKMMDATIELWAHSHNGVLYDDVESALYHEFNHLYEIYCRLKSGTYDKHRIMSIKSSARIDCDDAELQNAMAKCFYYLYSETELNALASEVYSDLKSLNSKRTNYREDIKKTRAYKIYKLVSSALPDVIQLLKQNKENVNPFVEYLKNKHINLNPYIENDNGYIKEFDRKTKYLLKRLYRGMCKSATLYYDFIENYQK